MTTRILNVDDNEAGRYVRTVILKRAGFEVAEAATGAEALRAFASFRPELVLLDMNLPDMSGTEICQRIKTGPEGALVIVLHISATQTDALDRSTALESGADGYLTEPVEPELLVATIRSLLRLRQVEETLSATAARLRLVQEAGGIGLWDWDIKRDELVTSPEYLELSGLPPDASPMAFDTWLGLAHPEDRERLQQAVTAALRGSPLEIEYRIICQDGGVRWQSSKGKVHYSQGEPVRMVAAIVDITDKKEWIFALQAANQNLERSNRDLQQFAYAVSHDLQEPLRTVSSYTELLGRRLKAEGDAEIGACLTFILDAAQRMNHLVRDLLAYCSLDATVEAPVKTDAGKTLDFALANLGTLLQETNAVVTHDPLPEVLADPAQLVQIYQNLITNAVKYRRPDMTPRVHIRADRDGERWRISVADNGQGFDQKYAERIFGVFKRLHGRDVPGTGIGLAICRRIIERHGGTIWADSTVDQGSTFNFTLPAATSDFR